MIIIIVIVIISYFFYMSSSDHLFVLNSLYHFDSCGMMLSEEGGIEPLIHDHLCQLRSDDTSSEAKHIGIIVHAAQLCAVWLRAAYCANSTDLIDSDRHTYTGTADSNSEISRS